MPALPTAAHPQKLYGLDHLRALAILMVMLFHYGGRSFAHPNWVPNGAAFGWTGVDLFFVLSGYLIASQLFAQLKKGHALSLRTFFLKRFFRIIPAYLFVVAIYFCFPFFREKEALPPLWKFLTFTQNFGLYNKDYGTFSHAWSLCVEEHFYFFLPFTILVLQITNRFKNSWWILLFLFLIGFGIRLFCWYQFYAPYVNDANAGAYYGKYIYYPTYNRLDGLLVGVAIAAIHIYKSNFWNKLIKYGNLLLVLGLVVLTGAYFLCESYSEFNTAVFGYPVVALGYGILICGALSPNSVLYKWQSKFTTFIATLSYGTYLTHKGVIHIIQYFAIKLQLSITSNLMLIICFVVCFAAAYLLHILLEKPFMKMRDRVLKKESKAIKVPA